MFDYDKTIGSIYDCAANPDRWVKTLEQIRDELGVAYLMVGYADMTPTLLNQVPVYTFRHTEWDVARLNQLQGLSRDVPGAGEFQNGVTDKAWTQMQHISREDFEKTRFCQEWSDPQQLSDCLIVPYLARPRVFGLFSAALHKTQGDVFNDQQKTLAEQLAPHLRRAIIINDIIDQGKLARAIYRKVLDALSTAVFVIGAGRRVAFSNAAGETLLSEGHLLTQTKGMLQAKHIVGNGAALDIAIDRACKGDAAIGISGIGVPLIGRDGESAAAYVLPIAGKDLRNDMGQGQCVVFVARRHEQQPMAMEILRTMFDLTASEARVATMIARGDGPQAIAKALAVSINTVRSHLARTFAKTGTSDQTGLGALVNQLMPPIAAT